MAETLSPERLNGFEDAAVELARAAGAAILPLFRRDAGLEDKGAARGIGFDPVTDADRGAEAAMRAVIDQRFPDHGVIGEEYGENRPDAEFVWVLDPIDGTRGFVSGLPLWTTLIALRWRGRPVVGLIAQPYLEEVFVGTALGSRLIRPDGVRQLQVRACPRLGDALIGSTDPLAYCTPSEQAAFARVREAGRLTRLGGDAYHFALVALGTLDLVVEPAALKPWDVEAALPLVEGAGGIASNWRGGPVGTNGGQVVLAGDRACLEAAVDLLKDAAA